VGKGARSFFLPLASAAGVALPPRGEGGPEEREHAVVSEREARGNTARR